MKLKQILTVLAVAAATVALVGCERPKGINVTSKEFERKVTEGVYKVAKAQYAFNKTTDQLYFNKATNTFRIVSNDGTKYIEVAFAAPIGSVGAKVQASVKSEGFEDVENFDSIEFEIMKKEGQNCLAVVPGSCARSACLLHPVIGGWRRLYAYCGDIFTKYPRFFSKNRKRRCNISVRRGVL